MKTYLDLMRKIFAEGNTREDRTGTGTIGLFAEEMRFDLCAGFPLVTTKKCHLRSIIHELLWFLSGETNNQILNANGVSIWDEWAVPEDTRVAIKTKSVSQLIQWIASNSNYSTSERAKLAENAIALTNGADEGLSAMQRASRYLTNHLDFKDKPFDPFIYKTVPKGTLGPIYGKMLRAYPTVTAHGNVIEVDQMAEVMANLRHKPFSRRHIVNLWHPGLLPDESISPTENALGGQQALAPCHYAIQFYVNKVTEVDACKYFDKYLAETYLDTDINDAKKIELAKEAGWREMQLSLKFTMRSTDVGLGLPYNIASYALMAHMVALDLDYMPSELIYSGGDVHIYSNHVEGLSKQITRSPRKLPKLTIKRPAGTRFDDFKFEDFELTGYDPHPHIPLPIAI